MQRFRGPLPPLITKRELQTLKEFVENLNRVLHSKDSQQKVIGDFLKQVPPSKLIQDDVDMIFDEKMVKFTVSILSDAEKDAIIRNFRNKYVNYKHTPIHSISNHCFNRLAFISLSLKILWITSLNLHMFARN